MSTDSSFSVVCCCTRTFFQQNAYTNHKRVCQRSRRHLAGALEKAKEVWAEKKRQRLTGLSSQSLESQLGASDLRVQPLDGPRTSEEVRALLVLP
jgi:hypothetical protein